MVCPCCLLQRPFEWINTGFIACFFYFNIQVIYRALSPWLSVDPYGPSAQNQLMVTNLRVRLLQHQPCPCQAKHPGAAVLPTVHYAIYDFIVKGSCLCNGHADHCVPARGYHPVQQTDNMVSNVELDLQLLLLWQLVQMLCLAEVCWWFLFISVYVDVVRLGVGGLGLIFSHHSPVTQLYSATLCKSWRLQWRLDIRAQLHLPLQGFNYVETLIIVFSLMP